MRVKQETPLSIIKPIGRTVYHDVTPHHETAFHLRIKLAMVSIIFRSLFEPTERANRDKVEEKDCSDGSQ